MLNDSISIYDNDDNDNDNDGNIINSKISSNKHAVMKK